MTPAARTLAALRACGLEVTVQAGNLAIAPASRVPAELLGEARRHKAALLAMLQAEAAPPPAPPPAMSSAAAILARVREAGGDLRLGPEGPRMVRGRLIPPAVQAEVRAHRAELVELLQAEEAELPDGPALIRATLAAEARRKAEVPADPAPLLVDDAPEARCEQCGDTFAPLRPGDRHCEICQPFAGPFAALEPSPEFLAKFFRCETCRVTVYAPARPARLVCRECERTSRAAAAGAQ